MLCPEFQYACQAEFSAALKLVAALEREQEGQPFAEIKKMAEMELRSADRLWQTLAARGISRPGCFVKRNDLPTRPIT